MIPPLAKIFPFVLLALVLAGAWTSVTAAESPSEFQAVSRNGITVRVEGVAAKEWNEARLLLEEQLRLAGDASPSEPLADDLAYFTRQHLLRHGWPEALVSWHLEKGGILLVAAKGAPSSIGRIQWSGDEPPVAVEELEALLLRPTKEHGHSKKNPPWVESAIQEGASLVQRRLRAEGYLKATAEVAPVPSAADSTVRDLQVTLRTGPVFSFGAVSVDGLPDDLAVELQALVSSRTGSPFNEAEVESLVQKLKGECESKGRLGTEGTARYVLGAAGGTVDVRISLAVPPISRVIELEPVDLLSAGAKRVLRSTFRPAIGRVYAPEDLDLMFRRSLDTGLFSRLDYAAKPVADVALNADSRPVTLTLDGEEAAPMSVGLYGGYETFSGPIVGVEFRHVNLINSGDQFRAAAEYSFGGPVGKAELTDPAIFGSGFSATAGIGLERFLLYDYSRSTASASLTVTRRVSIPFSYSLFVSGAVSSVDAPELTAAESGPLDYSTIGLGGSLTVDYRNSPVLPTKGWLLEARVEGLDDASGGGATFLRSSLRLGAYRPLTDRLRISAGARLASVEGASADDVPIDLRVFNGGATTVRSFAERELGPLSAVNQTPLGGTAAFSANLELSYSLSSNVEAAVFGDMGSLQTDPMFGFPDDLRYAIGAGLRYHLPFGPLRIDYGWNPDRRENEDAGALHISLGVAF